MRGSWIWIWIYELGLRPAPGLRHRLPLLLLLSRCWNGRNAVRLSGFEDGFLYQLDFRRTLRSSSGLIVALAIQKSEMDHRHKRDVHTSHTELSTSTTEIHQVQNVALADASAKANVRPWTKAMFKVST